MILDRLIGCHFNLFATLLYAVCRALKIFNILRCIIIDEWWAAVFATVIFVLSVERFTRNTFHQLKFYKQSLWFSRLSPFLLSSHRCNSMWQPTIVCDCKKGEETNVFIKKSSTIRHNRQNVRCARHDNTFISSSTGRELARTKEHIPAVSAALRAYKRMT